MRVTPLFLLLSQFFLTICLAQKSNPIPYTFLLFKECQSFGKFDLYILGKKTYNAEGYLILQEFYKKSSYCEYGALGYTLVYQIHLNNKNNIISEIDISNNVCQENFEKITILQNKIWSIQVNMSYYSFIYTHNRLSRINLSRTYDFYGKNDWRKNYYTFEYFPSGKIKSIKSFVSIGYGENIENIKELYSYLQEERLYFENDSSKIEIIRYEKKLNKEDLDKVYFNYTIEYKKETEREEFSMTDNIKNEPLNVRYITEFNTNNKVSKLLTLGSKGIILSEYKNQYDYNGLLIKTIRKNTSPEGLFLSSYEEIFNYSLKQNKNPENQCSYEPNPEIKQYDQTGSIISEIKNGKIRTKKTNGEWTQWYLKY
jgi:hypothetical protein